MTSVLSCLFCSPVPYPISSLPCPVPYFLSCPFCHVSPVLSLLPCPSCPVPNALSFCHTPHVPMSCPSAMSILWRLSWHILLGPPHLSYPSCPTPPFTSIMSRTWYPACPVPPDLSLLSFPSCPNVLPLCRVHHVPPLLTHPSCPVPPVTSLMSRTCCLIRNVASIVYRNSCLTIRVPSFLPGPSCSVLHALSLLFCLVLPVLSSTVQALLFSITFLFAMSCSACPFTHRPVFYSLYALTLALLSCPICPHRP